jgi:hypothetical protein
MLLYKLTHIPSKKIYLGALKDNTRWQTYISSSRIVRPMIEKNPSDWTKQILETFDQTWRWDEVIYLEQCLIKTIVKICGWDAVFNKIANTGTASMFAPEAREKITLALAKPDIRKKMSESNTAWKKLNPDAWLANREKAALTNRSIERREAAKIASLNYFSSTPEAKENLKNFWSKWNSENPESVLKRRIKINEILRKPEHRERASKQISELWKNQNYKKSQSLAHIGKHVGAANGAFKGAIFGVCIDDPSIILKLEGAEDIENAGFSSKNVYACLSGDRKSHQGYLFTREKLNEDNSYEFVDANSKGIRRRKKK